MNGFQEPEPALRDVLESPEIVVGHDIRQLTSAERVISVQFPVERRERVSLTIHFNEGLGTRHTENEGSTTPVSTFVTPSSILMSYLLQPIIPVLKCIQALGKGL